MILSEEDLENLRRMGGCAIASFKAPLKTEWLNLAKLVHELPQAELQQIHTSAGEGLRGYTPATPVLIDSSTSIAEKSRRYSSFDFGFDKPGAVVDEVDRILYARNLWPQSVPDFEDQCTALRDEWHAFAVSLLSEILRIDTIKLEKFFSRPTGNMRLLRYDAHHGESPLIPAHRDYEFLTLVRSSAPGLEIIDSTGAVNCIDELASQIVVIAGDCLEYITDGQIRAGVHQVRVPFERYSCIYFLCCDTGAVVEKDGLKWRATANSTDPFSPCEHVATMNLANHTLLRKKYRDAPIHARIPENGRNPFFRGVEKPKA